MLEIQHHYKQWPQQITLLFICLKKRWATVRLNVRRIIIQNWILTKVVVVECSGTQFPSNPTPKAFPVNGVRQAAVVLLSLKTQSHLYILFHPGVTNISSSTLNIQMFLFAAATCRALLPDVSFYDLKVKYLSHILSFLAKTYPYHVNVKTVFLNNQLQNIVYLSVPLNVI